jgi:hypothetical protein
MAGIAVSEILLGSWCSRWTRIMSAIRIALLRQIARETVAKWPVDVSIPSSKAVSEWSKMANGRCKRISAE